MQALYLGNGNVGHNLVLVTVPRSKPVTLPLSDLMAYIIVGEIRKCAHRNDEKLTPASDNHDDPRKLATYSSGIPTE